MSLPKFMFDADAYTGDTPHLTVEEHGAYLLLMLAYYRSEKPLPASDRALASICKMTQDQWLICKPTLAPFFTEIDGVWHHDRCDIEITKRNEEVAKYRARASAGANARWGDKKSSKHTTVMLQASETRAELEKEIYSLSAVLEVEKAESGENRPVTSVEAKEDQWLDAGLPPVEKPLTPIDGQFRPAPALETECLAWMDASTFHIEWQKFVYDAREKGKLSADWDASLRKWMERFREYANRPNARGKPRVQLNPDPPAGDEQTPAINWSWHLSRWLKTESSWSRRTAGPEPGQFGCRVPAEMLEKFNIDPATGRKKQTEPT